MSTKITNCFIIRGINGEIVIDPRVEMDEFKYNHVYSTWNNRKNMHELLDDWIDRQILEQSKTTPIKGIE